MPFLRLVTIIVADYDEAIAFFTDALGFELVEDSPAHTNDGARSVRWSNALRVRRPGSCWLAPTAIDKSAAIGNQHAGRVGFFLHTDDLPTTASNMRKAGVEFLTEPRTETYGQVVVFHDIAGNHRDLLGSTATT